VTFSRAIDAYIADMQAEGKLTTSASEKSYRDALLTHAEDCGWATDPRTTTRADVKRTLARWSNPNTQRTRRAYFVSFYDWMTQADDWQREDNPARATRPPKARSADHYWLTLEETRRFLLAAQGPRERRVAFLGVCVGFRRAELRSLQGLNFMRRPGFIWVQGKGQKARWEPIIKDLEPIVAEIQEHCEPDDYVICRQEFADPGWLGNSKPRDYPKEPTDPKTIWRIARRVGKRAGIGGPVGAHTMRRAFADHIYRTTGDVRLTQVLLGHADIGTTQKYLGGITLDKMTEGVAGVSFFAPETPAQMPLMETVGIEPTSAPIRGSEPKGLTQRFGRTLLALRRSPAILEAAQRMGQVAH
jgi:integrase/recombinase XerD